MPFVHFVFVDMKLKVGERKSSSSLITNAATIRARARADNPPSNDHDFEIILLDNLCSCFQIKVAIRRY